MAHKGLLETVCLVQRAIRGQLWSLSSQSTKFTSCSPAFFPSPSGQCLLLVSSLFQTWPKHHEHTHTSRLPMLPFQADLHWDSDNPNCFSPWHISREQPYISTAITSGASLSSGALELPYCSYCSLFLGSKCHLPSASLPHWTPHPLFNRELSECPLGELPWVIFPWFQIYIFL